MEQHQTNLIDVVFNLYTLWVWLAVIVLGVVLGIKQKVVIYRDYNDLFLAFLFTLAPIILYVPFLIFGRNEPKAALISLAIIESILFLWITIRTFKDNNVLGAFCALITKFSLSILFVISFISFVAPKGKTMSKRAATRNISLIVLLIAAPLVFALVKNKEGLFNPERMISRRGIGY